MNRPSNRFPSVPSAQVKQSLGRAMAFRRKRMGVSTEPGAAGLERPRAGARGAPAIASRAVRFLIASLLVCAAGATRVVAQSGGPLGTAQLQISGARLTLYADALTTDAEQTINVGEAARVRTCYGSGGACGSAAAGSVPGLKVVGDLSGPELPQAIPYETAPGGTFFLPGFQREGDYLLSNIRLVGRRRAASSRTQSRPSRRSTCGRSSSRRRASRAHARGPPGARDHDHAAGLQGVQVRGRFRLLGDHRDHRAARPLQRQRPRAAARQAEREAGRTAGRRGARRPALAAAEHRSVRAERDGAAYAIAGGRRGRDRPRGPALRRDRPPGNVSFLNQFFDARLIVANGAPNGSGATLQNVTGALKLPSGDVLRLAATPPPVAAGQKLARPRGERAGRRSARRSRGPRAGRSRASCRGRTS